MLLFLFIFFYFLKLLFLGIFQAFKDSNKNLMKIFLNFFIKSIDKLLKILYTRFRRKNMVA